MVTQSRSAMLYNIPMAATIFFLIFAITYFYEIEIVPPKKQRYEIIKTYSIRNKSTTHKQTGHQ